MKFKVLKGSDLFIQLQALRIEILRCNEATFEFVKSLGHTEFFGSVWDLAGGVSAIVINQDRVHGWKKVFKKRYDNVYYPSDSIKNRQLLHEFKTLPVVTPAQLNSILNYDQNEIIHEDNRMCFHPRLQYHGDVCSISLPDFVKGYKPVEGMIEITTSEYNSIKENYEKHKETK